MFITELLALIIAIVYGRKYKTGRFFVFYIAFDILVFCIDTTLNSLTTVSFKSFQYFVIYSNSLISMVELYAYFYFFHSVFQSKKIRISILILSVIYLLLIIIYSISGFSFLFHSARFDYASYLLGAIEFIFLIPFCFIYFNKLISTSSKLKILERPSFWITTGIFFFSLISIPYYLLYVYIFKAYKPYSTVFSAALYYTPFVINFIFLIKAFLCRKPLTI